MDRGLRADKVSPKKLGFQDSSPQQSLTAIKTLNLIHYSPKVMLKKIDAVGRR